MWRWRVADGGTRALCARAQEGGTEADTGEPVLAVLGPSVLAHEHPTAGLVRTDTVVGALRDVVEERPEQEKDSSESAGRATDSMRAYI